jgi:hypothetical protein
VYPFCASEMSRMAVLNCELSMLPALAVSHSSQICDFDRETEEIMEHVQSHCAVFEWGVDERGSEGCG